LPDTIQFKNGNQIINRYDAIGRKLSTRYYTILIASEVPISALQPGQTCKLAYNMDIIDETGTFYVNNITYDFNGCDPGVYGLKRVDNVEGYGDFSWGTFMAYMYNRKDHLGNIREVWNASNNSTTQHTQYYPSGLPWASNPTDHPESQPYKYNGKEFVEMHGYDTYDYGARGYYPAIGRFTSVDPLAEGKPWVSPYVYCLNNPVRYTDPDGRWEWDKTGNLAAQKGDQSYSLAKFLGTSHKNAMTILNRSGVTANDKGVLNLKAGQTFSKDNLWVGTKSGSGLVVNNTKEATSHYLKGNGEPADVGDQSIRELLSSAKFQEKHTKITTQIVNPDGNFSVDLTDETFHIGRTNVDYKVGGNGNSSSVNYTLFSGDGYWDPDFIDEKAGMQTPDKMGPNLERFGGIPYPYKTRERTFFFKPVEEKK